MGFDLSLGISLVSCQGVLQIFDLLPLCFVLILDFFFFLLGFFYMLSNFLLEFFVLLASLIHLS